MPKYIECPKCHSSNTLVKHGKDRKNNQRYYCKSCKSTSTMNNSVTSYLNNSDYTLKRFIGFMIDDVTLDVIARNLKINIKTAHYYRHLIFKAVSDYQSEIKLDGSILIDETFVRINEKQYKLIKPDGKGYRGLSFNQLCIITMMNLRGISTAKVSSRAMALPGHFIDLFSENIGNVVRFIHDGNPKQVKFMKQYGCEMINARKDDTEIYSTKIVDSLHSNIKRYLFKHAGFKLKYLQHYLDFFIYRHNYIVLANPKNMNLLLSTKNDMIEDLFKRAKKVKKTVTYRNYMNDTGITDILESRK